MTACTKNSVMSSAAIKSAYAPIVYCNLTLLSTSKPRQSVRPENDEIGSYSGIWN
jgi:hypothetical protein